MLSLAHFQFKERLPRKSIEKEHVSYFTNEKKEFLLNSFNKKKYFLTNESRTVSDKKNL